MAEYLRVVGWLLFSLGWLLLAASVPSHSSWRLLLGWTAVLTAVRFAVQLVGDIGHVALAAHLQDVLLTPALFLAVLLQFVVMYRRDGVRR